MYLLKILIIHGKLIADSARKLAQSSTYTDPSMWEPYGRIWFYLLKLNAHNGSPLFVFCPSAP